MPAHLTLVVSHGSPRTQPAGSQAFTQISLEGLSLSIQHGHYVLWSLMTGIYGIGLAGLLNASAGRAWFQATTAARAAVPVTSALPNNVVPIRSAGSPTSRSTAPGAPDSDR
jgi:hypothetical protein